MKNPDVKLVNNKKNKDKKTRTLSIHKFIPNMITIAALCAGLTGIQFAIAGRWDDAVLAIVIAAFLDGFDGAAARLLKASSKLGAELDSLSDFLCFGVAPPLILHLWSLHDFGRIGWIVALVFTIACALRLARFNANMKSDEEEEKSEITKKGYFEGVPAPVGAGMALLPMIISFQLDKTGAFHQILSSPIVIGIWTLIIAGLMVSRIPTFSTKQVKLPQKFAIPLLACFGLLAAGLINAPWPTLTLMGVIYAGLIPIILYTAYKSK